MRHLDRRRPARKALGSAGRCWCMLLLGMALLTWLTVPATAQQVGLSTRDAHGTDANVCESSQRNGIFHPSCYQATGSGDTLVSSFDAALRAASVYLAQHGTGATLDGGNAQWDVCNAQQGIVLPQSAVPSGGSGINLVGAGPGFQLNFTCTVHRTALPEGALVGSPLSQAAIWMPVQAAPHYTQYKWSDVTVYVNGRAPACMDMWGLVHVSSFTNIVMGGAAGDGTANSHCMRWGNSRYPSATANQVEFHNISIVPGGAQGSGFTAKLNLYDGVPAAVVTQGGDGYSKNTRLYLAGPPAHVDPRTGISQPCATMGSIQQTIVEGHISSPVLKGFAGCTQETVLRAFDPFFPMEYAAWFDAFTDSMYVQLNPQTGATAAVLVGPDTGNNHYQAVHPCCGMPVGVIEQAAGDSWTSIEFDGMGQTGMTFGKGARAVVFGSKFYWNPDGGSSAGAGSYSVSAEAGPITIVGDVCTSEQKDGGYTQVAFDPGYVLSPEKVAILAAANCATGKLITNVPGNGGVPKRDSFAPAAAASAERLMLSAPLTTITGSATIETIYPPSDFAKSGGCLDVVATGAWRTTTAGNVATALVAVPGTPYRACWNGAKWFLK